ncbi:hypothetical protein ACGFIJ_10645 [Microbispora bryophytorum]|uniref:hypothetical protein n=1 Tax=Microbispora bryophytorum TaxID=1460882 RepID=UPI0037238A69
MRRDRVNAGSPTTTPAGPSIMAAKAHRRPAVRRAPVPVLAVTGLCAVGYQAAGFDVPAVAYLFAVYAAMRAGHRVITVAASVTMPAALPLAAMAAGLHDTGATPCSHRRSPAG